MCGNITTTHTLRRQDFSGMSNAYSQCRTKTLASGFFKPVGPVIPGKAAD
jgi:hypothetical protein